MEPEHISTTTPPYSTIQSDILFFFSPPASVRQNNSHKLTVLFEAGDVEWKGKNKSRHLHWDNG